MRRLLAATFLVSSVAIGLEILLMRVLTIVQWHHFAWMIISLALLGYGASGTFIALSRPFVQRQFEQLYATSAALLSLASVLSYIVAQRIPFNALEIIWDPGQFLLLSSLYLVLFVPFFFAAVCIGSAFTCRKAAIARIYFADLLGAGVGAAAIVTSMFVLEPQHAIVMLALVALLAAALVTAETGPHKWLLAAQAAWALLLLGGVLQPWLALQVSPFKGLPQALEVVDSRVLTEKSGPLGMLTVVDSPTVPFRHAPGLSLRAANVPPDQLAVFTDADSMSVITRYDGDAAKHRYLGDVLSSLPYAVVTRPRVLVLGGGGGADVLLALYHDAVHVDVVELNPDMTRLVAVTHADFAGRLYDDARVRLHTSEARGFVARSEQRYDLVHLGLLDSFGASGAGVHALNESYIYTVEALQEYLAHTRPGGIVAISRWIRQPPRDTLKLFATARQALEANGVDRPGNRLALFRSWNMSLLLVSNGGFTPGQVAAMRAFAAERSFDVGWLPGITAGDTNRYNLLERPWLFEGATELLGSRRDEFIDRYKFRIDPATDDRPYFFHFFKWQTLPEVLALRKRGGASLVEWGYLVLVATLVQALLAGLLLILLPLLRVSRSWSAREGARFGGYFLLLGLAFLFIEMAFIQKLILFLSHPLYSVAVVLSGFLVFAGVGSALSPRVAATMGNPVAAAVAAIGILSLLYLPVLPLVFDAFMGSADIVRVAVALAIIAPLALCMGMPFPLGLARVADAAPDFVPWAWGINGFASVISAVLATVLAIRFGFSAVVVAAVLCYVLAAVLIRVEAKPS